MIDTIASTPEQPSLFPLGAPIREYFAEAEGTWFGWTKDRFRIMRPAHVTLCDFPLTQAGWDAAWRVLAVDHPQLAVAITARLRQDQELALLYQEYQRQEVWAELDECTLLGGHGWDQRAFPTGTDCVLRFTSDQLWVRPLTGWIPLLRVSYASSIGLDFSGPGKVQTGGRIYGGGFGLAGAAEGMIAATLINTLISRTKIQTIVRYQAKDLEAFFFHSKATPDDLRMKLSRVVSAIQAKPQVAPQAASTASELERIAALHQQGALTDEEFAAIKTKLIASL